jgi:hypothetical protein
VANFEHDVAFSFSSAQRDYVRGVVSALRLWGARIFYDEDFEVEIWGEDLNEYLQRTYRSLARFVVMFVSKEYANAAFPTAERRSAFAGAMHGSSTVLPVRFDDTEIPGLNVNAAYLSAETHTPTQLAEKIAKKLESAGIPLREPTVGTFAPRPRSGATERFEVALTDSDGDPVDGALVALVGANGNIVRLAASGSGVYTGLAPAGRLLRLWVAHPKHRALKVDDVATPDDIAISMGRSANVGSTVFFGSTGQVPGVNGRFAPIIEDGRSYVYIDNAAVNGKTARPAYFVIGTAFEVEDTDSSVTVVTIVDAVGNGSLVEYEAHS